MKKITTLGALIALLFLANQAQAKIWRVNNTVGINANYTDIATAINSGTTLPGDTIHIEPSVSGYNANITVTKRVVIIGNGYLLGGTGANTGLQANTTTSSTGYFVFDAGSRGSVIEGMQMSSCYLYEHQITVKRNNIQGWLYLATGCDSDYIQQNYFYGIYYTGNPTANRIVVTNNIFSASGYGIYWPSTVSGIVENNTFLYYTYFTIWNAQVDNNIFAGGSMTLNNCVFFNNICEATEFPAGNGNQQNIAMSSVWLGTGSNDGQYFLKPGSPALGTGYGGVDIGATGGPNPYKISGIPDVPSIYQLTVPPTGTSTINVTISTRSNN